MKLRNRKFIVSVLTALMMVFTLVPGMAFADEAYNSDYLKVDQTNLVDYPAENSAMRWQVGPNGQALKLVDIAELTIKTDPNYDKAETGYRNYILEPFDSTKPIEFIYNLSGGQCSGVSIENIEEQTMPNIFVCKAEDNDFSQKIASDENNKLTHGNKVLSGTGYTNKSETESGYKNEKGYNLNISLNGLSAGEEYALVFDNGVAGKPQNKTGKYETTLGCQVVFYFSTKTLVDSIKLDKTDISIYHGSTTTISATVAPEDATDKTIVWTSSNEKVATVKDGKVTAVGVGTATIKATSNDGNASAECKVTVKPVKVSKVKVNTSKTTVAVGSSKTLKALVYPSNATNKAVTWKSSNSKIAKVSSTGKVTAVKAGKATVTVTTKDGSFKAKTVINVIPKSTTFKLYAKKHSIAIKYKKIKGVSGYEVYRASSKNGKYKKVTTRLQRYPDTYTSIWLRSDKTYYYKIRTYKTVDGKKVYSKFSEVKKIRTK
ncbi:MAG: Ig-like domain-containing protein [Bacillota bacterium]|nr:Ig-like domain-containing protein [Bacillota bacterium]